MDAEMWWRSIIGDAIYALRHQPELTREQIAEALVTALVDGVPTRLRPEGTP